MYGLRGDECESVRLNMCDYCRGGGPTIDELAGATSHLPTPPPLLPHTLGNTNSSQPNVPHSGMQWDSGRTSGAFPLHMPHGCGSSPAGELRGPDSRLASFHMVAMACSMFSVLWCRAHRVGAIRWLTSGPHYPNGSADVPARSRVWVGVVVSRLRLSFSCVLGK